ncbi:hypothetical protein quinque_012452 [Culex quinquefasciatus]
MAMQIELQELSASLFKNYRQPVHLSLVVLLALVGAIYCELSVQAVPEPLAPRRAQLMDALAAKLDKLELKPELKAEMLRALKSMQETRDMGLDQAKERREQIRRELLERVAKETKSLRGH